MDVDTEERVLNYVLLVLQKREWQTVKSQLVVRRFVRRLWEWDNPLERVLFLFPDLARYKDALVRSYTVGFEEHYSRLDMAPVRVLLHRMWKGEILSANGTFYDTMNRNAGQDETKTPTEDEGGGASATTRETEGSDGDWTPGPPVGPVL